MKTSIRIALCLLVLACVSTWNIAQEKVTTTITILVPEKGEEETIVKVNGKRLDGEGDTRIFKMALEKGKEYQFKIEALVEPNNYTKIIRRKEITLKGGEHVDVKIVMTAEQPFDERTPADLITVRYVPTPDDIVDEMCKLGKVGKNDVVYDLGCGDARLLVRPIQKFGAKRGVGVEYDAKVLKEEAIPNVKKHKLEDKIELRLGDILKLKPKDLEDATVVMIYIGDDLGKRVSPVLKNALKPGSRIVSHRFLLGDWTPKDSIKIKGADGLDYDLHLWIVPEMKLDKGKDKK